MVSHLEPKIAQNPEKSCSRGLPESSLKKVTKNDAIWMPFRPQKSRFRAVGVAKIKKQPVTKHVLKMTSTWLPFWSSRAPQITNKTEKRALKKTLKIASNKYQKIITKKPPPFARKCHQNYKNPSLGLKMCPQACRRGSQAPKILQKSSKNEPPGLENHSKS